MERLNKNSKTWYGYNIVYSKRARGVCVVAHCRSILTHSASVCSKHRLRQWRENHPLRALFLQTKWNAKKRRIPFELTYEQFRKFARETGYDDAKARGHRKKGLTIDREDARESYNIDNIKILTRSANSRKRSQDIIDAYLMSKI